MREWAKGMSGGEAAQAEGTASGKVLRQESAGKIVQCG